MATLPRSPETSVLGRNSSASICVDCSHLPRLVHMPLLGGRSCVSWCIGFLRGVVSSFGPGVANIKRNWSGIPHAFGDPIGQHHFPSKEFRSLSIPSLPGCHGVLLNSHLEFPHSGPYPRRCGQALRSYPGHCPQLLSLADA